MESPNKGTHQGRVWVGGGGGGGGRQQFCGQIGSQIVVSPYQVTGDSSSDDTVRSVDEDAIENEEYDVYPQCSVTKGTQDEQLQYNNDTNNQPNTTWLCLKLTHIGFLLQKFFGEN